MRNDLILSPWEISGDSSGWHDDFCESVFFLGNGRMGVRGYTSSEPDKRPIQKGLYLAGIFGEIKPGITDFVNLPTPVREAIEIDGAVAELDSVIHRTLDLNAGTLTMNYTLRSGGKRLDVSHQRFFPKDHPELLLQRLILTPRENMYLSAASGIMVESCNSPIPDDQTKDATEIIRLAQDTSSSCGQDGIACHFSILGTGLTILEEVRFHAPGFRYQESADHASLYSAFAVSGSSLRLDKLCRITTSRDVDPRISPMPGYWSYDSLLKEHIHAWSKTWKQCDFTHPLLDSELQTGLRYSMYQLMASCSAEDPTVSIGARGLSHGRYKGCYFWDTDLFMLPFFLENDPKAARNLCDYRVRSLDAAKTHSKKMNTAGARYPWMAALDGSEQCESWDIGCSELHITADVAYALDAYCRKSGDTEFYLDRAAKVFIETARFWVSRYRFRPETGEADLLFCKGPDEYCGITNNNLFTNVMVQHNLALAVRAARDLREHRPEVYSSLGLSQAEVTRMAELRNAIKWPRDPSTGNLAQDDTFHLLEPVALAQIKVDAGASYHHICFDRLQRYRVIKQADVLLLMTRMSHLFSDGEKRQAWLDFEPLCLHDSTLSFASHALFALQNGFMEKGMDYLRKALLLDLRDVMSNTGHEGLHLACMGEGWQAAFALTKRV